MWDRIKALIQALFGPSSEVLWLRSRVEVLEAQIRDFKKGGFVYEPSVTYAQEDSGVDERIELAVTHMASGDSRLAADMLDWAKAQLIVGVEVEDLVDKIHRGASIA
jgi:DNA-binding transcriptional regulator YbjK